MALAARVEDLQKSLEQTSQQLSDISAHLANAQQTSSAPSAAVENRLTQIEQQMAQIELTEKVTGETVTARPASAPRPHKAVSASVAGATVHRRSAKPSVEVNEAAIMASAPAWVLRGATPDEAWVSKDATSRELRPVHIDDTLPGIGRVTAIRETAGGWVIDGTQGSVR